jgi:quinohemoprotein ethanol dehydrogenase
MGPLGVLMLCCAAALLAGNGIAAGVARGGVTAGSDTRRDWASVGRRDDEEHFSPLANINRTTIARLKLAWYFDIPGIVTAVSTPLEVGGTLYFVVGFGLVRALDSRTGKIRWEFDPHAETASEADIKMRSSWGVRGLAYGDGRVYVGTVDGRLLAIDARSGNLSWSAKTTEPGDGRFISGAPRYFNGKVIIGHGGGDTSLSRGYVTAYDALSGAALWRFFTVPGNPARGFENAAMEKAAGTWSGDWWTYGGGGTVWNAITFDADQDLIIIGTGNGVPWNPKIRSPGGGDNLYICSIVALNAQTGAYVWHYQVSPGDAWDYDATQDIELATLPIHGVRRKVLLQASKNGFFYVIDRVTGKLISADAYGHETWAQRIDLTTGRPVESVNARYLEGGVDVWPDPNGEHSWHAMSFNPSTGLAYIPSFAAGIRFDDSTIDVKNWPVPPLGEALFGIGFEPLRTQGISALIAWDPVKRKAAWRAPLEPGIHGGTLTTGGGLVFQGRGDGQFVAYDAASGERRWSYDAQNGIIGAPITYESAGRQYVTVIAGYNGLAGVISDLGVKYGWDARTQHRRVLTFMLDGGASLPAPAKAREFTPVSDPDYRQNSQLAAAGAAYYGQRCYLCHGPAARAGGQAPDLRTSSLILTRESFASVLHDGVLQEHGMPGFSEVGEAEIEAIRQYLRAQAAEARSSQSAPPP